MSPQDDPRADISQSDLPGGDGALAAEYVLGLLGGDEQATFEARLEQEPDLRAEVAFWFENLSDLAGDLPPVDPAPAVLRRIEIAAFGQVRAPLWRQILPYVLGAVAAAAVAWGAMVSGLLVPGDPSVAELRADLVGSDSNLRFAARVDRDSGALILTLSSGTAPQTGALQLWLIAGQGAPVPLGLLDGAATVLALPAGMPALPAGATLALTLEPAGGSATGAPTGAVLARGILTPS